MTTQRAALPAAEPPPPAALRWPLRPARRAVLWSRGALGRYLSVRWKLTLWYGLMCGLTLGFLGLGMRINIDNQAKASIDSGLRATADRLLIRLRQPSLPYGPLPTQVAFQTYVRRVQQVLVENSFVLTNPGGFEQVQLSEPGNAPACFLGPHTRGTCNGPSQGIIDPSLIYDVSLVTSSGKPKYDDITYTGNLLGTHYQGERLRVYLVRLTAPDRLAAANITGALEVYQPEHTYLEFEGTINRILLFGIPLALIIALAVGWWIARAALRPIDRISRTVRTIGESQDLSRRLNFVGPTDEVGRLAETFDGMMDRLESVFETQRRFVADASHELRTPLTAIRGNAELFSKAPPEEREVCVASIRREAERMSRLVADLLLLAAADIEEQPVHMRPVALDDVVREVHRSALLLAADKVTVLAQVDSPVTVQADPDRIKQLLLNLVDNAVKFTPKGGSVVISLASEPGGARLAVSDTGAGIPEADLKAIFQRFYRVEHARSTRGSGLGLAISAWIVEAHHGRIEVQSALGEGSTFTVHLPFSPSS